MLVYAPSQIPQLVAPLSDDSPRILQEGRDNQEPANGRQMGLQWLCVNLNIVLDLASERAKLFDWIVGIGGSVASRRS